MDFFDVAVSGVIRGITAGYGAAASAGHKIGRVGSFVMNHPKLLSLGETALTSTIDITGEGWQDVSYQQVGTRLVSVSLTYAVRTGLQKIWREKLPSSLKDLEVSDVDGISYVNKIGGKLRSLDDLNSLKGASWEEVEAMIPENWLREALKKGEGIKFINPNKRGEQILFEKGWQGAKDLLHIGPYLKISRNGKVERIPLKGNPILK